MLGELAGLEPYGYRLTTDSGTWEGAALLVAAANTRYIGGGMDLSPRADAADGLLDVLRLDPVGRVRLLGLLARIFSGAHLRDPAVHLERSRVLTIEALPPTGRAARAAVPHGRRRGRRRPATAPGGRARCRPGPAAALLRRDAERGRTCS